MKKLTENDIEQIINMFKDLKGLIGDKLLKTDKAVQAYASGINFEVCKVLEIKDKSVKYITKFWYPEQYGVMSYNFKNGTFILMEYEPQQ